MFNLGLGLLVAGLLLSLMWEASGFLICLVALGVWVWAVLRFVWDRWHGVPHLPASPLGGRAHPKAGGVAQEPDRLVALDDPEIPPSIRAMARADAQAGDTLWRCVRRGGHRGPLAWFNSGERRLVLEWWWLSAEGELIKAYWPQR